MPMPPTPIGTSAANKAKALARSVLRMVMLPSWLSLGFRRPAPFGREPISSQEWQ
jgi:hypothetical protein